MSETPYDFAIVLLYLHDTQGLIGVVIRALVYRSLLVRPPSWDGTTTSPIRVRWPTAGRTALDLAYPRFESKTTDSNRDHIRVVPTGRMCT